MLPVFESYTYIYASNVLSARNAASGETARVIPRLSEVVKHIYKI